MSEPADDGSAQMLAGWADRHGGEPRLGCSLVAHRDLGLCAACRSPHDGRRNGAERELNAWRLLAMAQRGVPHQPSEATGNRS